VWLLMAGRGYGKTRIGAETVRERITNGRWGRVALVAATAADARDVMIEGESGLLAISPPWWRPEYEPSKRRLTWPNGAMATAYSSETPSRLRGPQHDGAWCDEVASWKNASETWDMLMFGLRLGLSPQVVATTTPKPIRLVRDMVRDPRTVVTGGSTYENAPNLAQAAIDRFRARYEGTSLGQQELHAVLLTEVPGALWKRSTIDANRVDPDLGQVPAMLRIVVAIDPAVTSGEDSDDTGIIVAGLGVDGHVYVLWDATQRSDPFTWASEAVRLFHHYQADAIVAEVNNGGDLVAFTLATVDANVPVHSVHASRGKRTRAEPVSAKYEQGLVHHLKLPSRRVIDESNGQVRDVPVLEDLEDQLCTWTTDSEESPDRLDALVWAVTALVIGDGEIVLNWDEEYEIDPTY
jgi:phage terminase large subunit-like protein